MSEQEYGWSRKPAIQPADGDRGFLLFLLCTFALAIVLFAIAFF